MWRYIIVCTNSISSSGVALVASIPYPYLLAMSAHSSSVGAMVREFEVKGVRGKGDRGVIDWCCRLVLSTGAVDCRCQLLSLRLMILARL